MIYEQVVQGDVRIILLKRKHLVALLLDRICGIEHHPAALGTRYQRPQYSQKSQPDIGSLMHNSLNPASGVSSMPGRNNSFRDRTVSSELEWLDDGAKLREVWLSSGWDEELSTALLDTSLSYTTKYLRLLRSRNSV